MNRLTKKIEEDFYHTSHYLINFHDVTYKLGKLEDLEEELGVELTTLFKALENGFYFKYKDKIINSNNYLCDIRVNLNDNWVFAILDNKLSLALFVLKFKDYGKTWALSFEELEKEEE